MNTLLITQIKYNFHTCKVSSPESKEHNKVRVKYVDVGPSVEQLLQNLTQHKLCYCNINQLGAAKKEEKKETKKKP